MQLTARSGDAKHPTISLAAGHALIAPRLAVNCKRKFRPQYARNRASGLQMRLAASAVGRFFLAPLGELGMTRALT
jgi:hypothetical protein